MNSRERVLTALQVKQPDRVPWMEAGIDAALQAQIMGKAEFSQIELADALGLDALTTDLLPPIFSKVERRGDREFVGGGLLTSETSLDLMQFPNPNDPELYTPLKRLVDENHGERAICLRIRLGVSPLLMSMGLEAFSYALVDNRGLVDKILSAYADWTICVLEHVHNAGVDFVWSMDDIAYKTAPMFSPAVFRQVFLPEMGRVAQAIKGAKLPWVYHSDGNLTPLLDDLLSLGMDGLHPIEPGAMDIGVVKERYGHRLCIVGNIDLHYTLTRGSTGEVDSEVRERIAQIGKGGGYIVSSANTLTSYCKVENVLAMRDAIARYGTYAAN